MHLLVFYLVSLLASRRSLGTQRAEVRCVASHAVMAKAFNLVCWKYGSKHTRKRYWMHGGTNDYSLERNSINCNTKALK